jgi:hypothetical protein
MTLAIGLLAASALSLSCTVDPPRSVAPTPQGVVSRPIGLPPEMNQWKFDLALTPNADSIETRLDWPGDPIGVGATTEAIQIGPSDYSFISLHTGSCLFTERGCFFMYTLSAHNDGSADILVQPSAIANDSKGDRRNPFQVYMAGRCTPKGERG